MLSEPLPLSGSDGAARSRWIPHLSAAPGSSQRRRDRIGPDRDREKSVGQGAHMCLGIPGRVIAIEDDELRMGRVEFGGVVKEACLAYVPEAHAGDYGIVHAGFAISRVDEAQARQ